MIIALTATLIACDKDDDFQPGINQINWQFPKEGQENYYLRYGGECGSVAPNGDTLIFRIKTVDGNQLELEERFTPGSPSYSPLSYIYPATWSKDFVDIDADYRINSQLFFFFGSDSLRLTQAPSMTLNQSNCFLWNGEEQFRGDAVASVPNFKVVDQSYGTTKIVSCVPGIFDLDAYLAYDKNNLYSSYTIVQSDFPPAVTVSAYALINVE